MRGEEREGGRARPSGCRGSRKRLRSRGSFTFPRPVITSIGGKEISTIRSSQKGDPAELEDRTPARGFRFSAARDKIIHSGVLHSGAFVWKLDSFLGFWDFYLGDQDSLYFVMRRIVLGKNRVCKETDDCICSRRKRVSDTLVFIEFP